MHKELHGRVIHQHSKVACRAGMIPCPACQMLRGEVNTIRINVTTSIGCPFGCFSEEPYFLTCRDKFGQLGLSPAQAGAFQSPWTLVGKHLCCCFLGQFLALPDSYVLAGVYHN